MGLSSKAAKAVDKVDQHLAARHTVTGAASVAHIQAAADTVSAALDAGVTLTDMRDVRASRKTTPQ